MDPTRDSKKKFTPAQLRAAYKETARRRARCEALGDHEFRFIKFSSNWLRQVDEHFDAEIYAFCGCTRCNTGMMTPIGQDAPTAEMS